MLPAKKKDFRIRMNITIISLEIYLKSLINLPKNIYSQRDMKQRRFSEEKHNMAFREIDPESEIL